MGSGDDEVRLKMLEFIRLSPGLVIATHMEALNHCPMTRDQLRRNITETGLAHKVQIPRDGDLVV